MTETSNRSYKDLIVWQRAVKLCIDVYAATRRLPADERFGLCAQLRRAAVSVPSNVAEGYSRGTRPDYVRFLWVANGSLGELETQFLIVRELGFLDAPKVDALLANISEIIRLNRALIRSLTREVRP
ncbi:hypothetical protein RAS1_43460 [Phycisphaerae bacterium RAS1]|nr:hypothetical protein RAS1_43460 [Phycisphaerae bacterium RAS1]